MEKKKRIEAFDLIRSILTIGIVLFHYSFNYIEFDISGTHLSFARFINGNWGGMFVAMFFMLSGAVLMYNYGDHMKIGRFYFRRWLSIYPMFYTAWFFAYLQKVQELGSWLWAGPKKLFIWTILGVDGYFLNPGVNINYYTLGEWFLGAIIMLYVAFPLLRLIFLPMGPLKTWVRYIFTVVLFVLFTANLYYDWHEISDGKNMLTCLMGFWLGMLIIELYRHIMEKGERFRRIFTLCCALVAVFIMIGPIGEQKEVMISHICGALWMMVFMYVGEYLMKKKPVAFVCSHISKWSFGIFLVHHVILYAVMENFAHGSVDFLQSLGLFFALMALICLVGAVLTLWGGLVSRCIMGIADLITGKKKKTGA